MSELITTLTAENNVVHTITTGDILTVEQVNISPIYQVLTFDLNSNVLDGSLVMSIDSSLTNGPVPVIYDELSADGLSVPLGSHTVHLLVRGLALILVYGKTLTVMPANSPTNTVRQKYTSLFPVGTSDVINNGVLRRKMYLTAIVSPYLSGDTWRWPVYNTSVSITGDTTNEDTDIYPYES